MVSDYFSPTGSEKKDRIGSSLRQNEGCTAKLLASSILFVSLQLVLYFASQAHVSSPVEMASDKIVHSTDIVAIQRRHTWQLPLRIHAPVLLDAPVR